MTSGANVRRFAVRYFAASVDSETANAKFARSLGVDYPILSDPTKATARAYGVLGLVGLASRWTFYIGADGRILEIDKHVSAGKHGEDVVATLSRIGVRSAEPGTNNTRTRNPEPGT